MKQLLEFGNRYAAKSDWTDFALTKFCLCALGVIVGVNISKKNKKYALLTGGGVFALTYIILMKRVFDVANEMIEEKKA